MQGTLEQKYKQIFQVKIKQQRLCQLLQTFSNKIHNLQESHKSFMNNMSMNNILDEVKVYVKALFKEESTQMAYKFYQKVQLCNKDINRIDYSCKNFEKNLRTEFETLNEKEKLLEKTVSYINCQEIQKLRTEIEKLNINILLSKNELTSQISADRQKINQVQDKFHGINQILQGGQQKLQEMQEAINLLGKKLIDVKHIEAFTSKIDSDKQKDKDNDRLPPPQIIKKSRISARRTIDNTSFQRSFDQTKEAESKQNKQVKEYKQKREGSESRSSDFLAMNRKIQNLEKRVSGIVDSNINIPTSQNIQNQRESLLSSQQLMQFNKYDSAQNIDRNPNKRSSMKRNVSNFKRGSIRTEQNQGPLVEDYGRSAFATNIQSNEIRKINDRLTALHFKNTLLEQNYQALLSKINKLGSLQASVQGKIEQAEKLRVDVNTINEIKLRFKQIQTSMELQQIRYVNHSTYQKEMESIHKRITAIDSVVPMLAKKEEVVSAFTFIQKKIKEIVIVLSNKFEEEKIGAINKIQNIRCLTCDKEANLTDVSRPNSKINLRNTQNNRFSYDKNEITKRIKTQQNQ